MKLVILVFITATVFAYDDIDVNEHFEAVLKQPDELRKQLYCYLDKGPCSELALHHKRHMEQSIKEACAHCSPSHKHNVHLFISAAIKTYPELYKEMKNKYDPAGKFYDHLLQEIERY